MKIKSIEQIDNIVKTHSNFKWDGWTVVVEEDGDGYSSVNGVYTENGWKIQKRFECIKGVWDIPDRYITHVQV
jgi:hypothetical protein